MTTTPLPTAWQLRSTRLALPHPTGPLRRPLVMGIVNVTPDSFSDGGRHAAVDAAVAHGLRLVAEGADLLDVGGEHGTAGKKVSPAGRTEANRCV